MFTHTGYKFEHDIFVVKRSCNMSSNMKNRHLFAAISYDQLCSVSSDIVFILLHLQFPS